MPAPDWRHRAACKDVDPELFFPIGSTGFAEQDIQDAKDVCAGCNVITACLDWAIASGQDSGIWGGMTEDERRTEAIRRRSPNRMAV